MVNNVFLLQAEFQNILVCMKIDKRIQQPFCTGVIPLLSHIKWSMIPTSIEVVGLEKGRSSCGHFLKQKYYCKHALLLTWHMVEQVLVARGLVAVCLMNNRI